jgi:hypothetical protein
MAQQPNTYEAEHQHNRPRRERVFLLIHRYREGSVEAGRGRSWRTAGSSIKAYSIGWGRDFEDIYRDWERKREVEEDCCTNK